MPMHPAIIVGLGGAIGSIARWGIYELIPSNPATEIPWSTVSVNLLGAFLLGIIMAISKIYNINSDIILFIAMGILGGFTTMSTFGFETFSLIESNKTSSAIIYILLNLLAPIMAWFGWKTTYTFIA